MTQPFRKVILFGHPYEWTRREADGGKKAPKRKKGQLLLRRVRVKNFTAADVVGANQPHTMPALVPPCLDRLRAPVLTGYVETGMVERA